MDSRLSLKEKGLAAVAASVAAGCTPCTQYHVKEVKAAGATTEEVSTAIDAALCVKNSARAIIEQVAYTAIGQPKMEQPFCGAGPSDRIKELASIAAAVAVNCPANLHKHIEVGRTLGLRDEEIQVAVGLARAIRGKAIEKVDEAVKNLSLIQQSQEQACCGPTANAQKTPLPQTGMPQSPCCGPAVSVAPDIQPLSAAKRSCC